MAGFWEGFVNWLNPCVHQWRVVEKLRNDEKNPTAVKLVRECSICGEIRTVDIAIATKCPPHQWRVERNIRVWPKGVVPNDPQRAPDAEVIVYACTSCGETKAKRLTSEGFMDEKPKEKKRA